MDEQALNQLTESIYCLCECMGMQSENMQRSYRGESMAFTEEDFIREIRKRR